MATDAQGECNSVAEAYDGLCDAFAMSLDEVVKKITQPLDAATRKNIDAFDPTVNKLIAEHKGGRSDAEKLRALRIYYIDWGIK
jgi:hypothetical protein